MIFIYTIIYQQILSKFWISFMEIVGIMLEDWNPRSPFPLLFLYPLLECRPSRFGKVFSGMMLVV